MMRTLYSTAIGLYSTAVHCVAPIMPKAAQMVAGWRTWKETLGDGWNKDCKVAWFHVSSLGEFEQARPVLELFRSQHAEYRICLTFFSPSGYEIRKNYPLADKIIYLPPDTRRNARQLVELMHPDMAFFVKYDFWFNYLHQLSRHSIPTYIFSSIFRPRQYFFKWYGRWFANHLKTFAHLFVQNEQSIELLHGIGITQCSLAGDTRFDRVDEIARQAKPIAQVERFIEHSHNAPIIVAGSTWEPDEKILEYLLHTNQHCKIILAPHQIHEGHLKQIETIMNQHGCTRFSRLAEADEAALSRNRVVVIDNIGMLSSLYRYATVAYIGGGFGQGIHNTLEAAIYGCPVCFGPNYGKFQEAKDLIACGAAKTFSSQKQIKQIITLWLEDKTTLQKASQASHSYMQGNMGATQKIMQTITVP